MKTKRESRRKRGNAAAAAAARGLPLVPLGGAGSAREPHSFLRALVLWESACLLRKVAGWWLRPGCPTPGGGKPCMWAEERCSPLLLISSTNCFPSSTGFFLLLIYTYFDFICAVMWYPKPVWRSLTSRRDASLCYYIQIIYKTC